VIDISHDITCDKRVCSVKSRLNMSLSRIVVIKP
jgi:hypothetical protein